MDECPKIYGRVFLGKKKETKVEKSATWKISTNGKRKTQPGKGYKRGQTENVSAIEHLERVGSRIRDLKYAKETRY